MTLPLHTSRVTVWRVDNHEPYDPTPEPESVATGVRAHISTATGGENVAGGSQEVVNFRMSCDQFDGGLRHTDTVEDEATGEVYEVVWSVARNGVGLDHFQAGLKQVSGVVSGGGARR